MDKPLQVILEDRDYRELSDWAKERGWTKSQAVRVAIRALTRTRESKSLLAASGFIDGLPRDLSARFDRYLKDTYVVAKDRRRARTVRR
jgi:hypothetical protein